MNSVQVWLCEEGIDIPKLDTRFAGQNANSISQTLPNGVYTTLRTYGRTKCFNLDRHFDRLKESARILGTDLTFDRMALRCKMRVAINNQSDYDLRIRIQIPLTEKTRQIFLIIEPLTVPTQDEILHGVHVLTSAMHRDSALAKATSFIATAEKIRQTIPEGINEILMVGEGDALLEGLSSNFLAVREGAVWTADEGILNGITRNVVLQSIRDKKIPLQLLAVHKEDIPSFDEAFLTSTSRGVLPISRIDNCTIGTGKPGPITQKIRTTFEERVLGMLEEF